MDIENIKHECLRIARLSWQNNQRQSYVVCFREEEYFTAMLPRFVFAPEMLKTYLDALALEENWDAMALFRRLRGGVNITLLAGSKMFSSTADIIDDYGAVTLSDFTPWEECDSLERCVANDVNNALLRRVENG